MYAVDGEPFGCGIAFGVGRVFGWSWGRCGRRVGVVAGGAVTIRVAVGLGVGDGFGEGEASGAKARGNKER
jgi:hypothetical protein